MSTPLPPACGACGLMGECVRACAQWRALALWWVGIPATNDLGGGCSEYCRMYPSTHKAMRTHVSSHIVHIHKQQTHVYPQAKTCVHMHTCVREDEEQNEREGKGSEGGREGGRKKWRKGGWKGCKDGREEGEGGQQRERVMSCL